MTDQSGQTKPTFFQMRGRTISIFGRSFDLPASRIARIVIGLLFILGGCFAFLPVLGVWMLPLGFMILSIDIAFIRRWRRRTDVRWSRWRAERRARKAAAVEERRLTGSEVGPPRDSHTKHSCETPRPSVGRRHEASWRNGYAEDCKSLYSGSIPDEASSDPD